MLKRALRWCRNSYDDDRADWHITVSTPSSKGNNCDIISLNLGSTFKVFPGMWVGGWFLLSISWKSGVIDGSSKLLSVDQKMCRVRIFTSSITWLQNLILTFKEVDLRSVSPNSDLIHLCKINALGRDWRDCCDSIPCWAQESQTVVERSRVKVSEGRKEMPLCPTGLTSRVVS